MFLFCEVHSLPPKSILFALLAGDAIFAQCIKGRNRLRAAVKVFDAEKPAGSAVSAEYSQKSPDSGLVFCELSPLIYHESECDLSSQVIFKNTHSSGNYKTGYILFAIVHTRNVQVHILLPFIPPAEAVKLHVLFNVYVHICVFSQICLFLQ